MLIEEPTDDEIALFRQIGAETAASIKNLEAQLATTPAPMLNVAATEEIHRRMREEALAPAIAEAVALEAWPLLQEVVVGLVESARVVDRVPENKSTWLRVAVTWVPEIQALLDAGLVRLEPEPQRPDYPATKAGQQRARYLRYAARKKAGLVPSKPLVDELAS